MADSNITVGNILIKITTQVNQASKACDTINKKLESISKKLLKVGNTTNKVAKDTEKSSKKIKNSLNFASMLGKVYFLMNYFKRLGTAIGNTATNAINFYETLNKFQVSMGGNYEQALKFVDKLTQAFNLSTESVMNYQSTFMNMLSALGNLGDDVSYKLSESMTQMAIDYASLFNVSIDTAMSQFQSALSGQVNNLA